MKSATLLHIPHASTNIPEKYARAFESEKLQHEKNVMTDWFCGELFDCGRDKLVFPVSRLVCDVERFRDDGDEIMSRVGMGAVYTHASDLSVLRNVKETEKEEILAAYYDAHHALFTEAVGEKLKKYGKCIIIDCHSFHPTPLPYEIDQNTDRPDFCIGTSGYHTPEALTERLIRFLSGRGYGVKTDSPFSGTIVPMKYFEKDRRVRSVMIEVNRKLYMNSHYEKNSGFLKIKSLISECIDVIEESPDFQ